MPLSKLLLPMRGKKEQTRKSFTSVFSYKCWDRCIVSYRFGKTQTKDLNWTGVFFLEEGEIYSFKKHMGSIYCVPGIVIGG